MKLISATQVEVTNPDGTTKVIDMVEEGGSDVLGEPEILSNTSKVRSAAVASDGTFEGSYKPPNALSQTTSRRLMSGL